MAEKLVKIKITSAIAIAGKIVTAGKRVEVAESMAKNLMERGRAELATADKKQSVDDLKAQAADLGIEGYANMKKAELIAAIEAVQSE